MFENVILIKGNWPSEGLITQRQRCVSIASSSIDQLPLAVAHQPVVQLAVVLRVHAALSVCLLVQAVHHWRQRREVSDTGQRVAVLPLILVKHQQVALLDSLVQPVLLLSLHLVFHLGSGR